MTTTVKTYAPYHVEEIKNPSPPNIIMLKIIRV